ncbi:aspartate/glutamate racemase family protein [Rhodophyticola sp. CCM32]|uniref:aspartate/glutamate racemase family protein n=1 Tax=Rhodophyticola sp. CCM32 TaxID=2916397 RepID=UPI00107F8C2A|nr:aspartate/glutamate racemase family protein [Rhodophyticola sp. CCM32]QBY00531.1 aspartate/glutamate racemase family protein [Rhodophyticola sp. CCM32]
MPQPTLGILSLDTRFPRIMGDVGNPGSYPFDVHIEIVEGADSPGIVRDGAPDAAVLARLNAAALRLEQRGVAAIISTCGFLITSQAHIAAAVEVPVMLSALSLYPMVQAACPGRIGILTASQPALGPRALAAAGILREDVAIAGLEQVPAFAEVILVTRDAQPDRLDRKAIEQAVVAQARALQARHDDLSALILECGNLPPYSGAIRAATGLPVFHLADAACALVAATRNVRGQSA